MECSHCCSGRRNNGRRRISSSSISTNVCLIFFLVCFLKHIIYANCTGIVAWSKPNAWSKMDLGTGRALHVWETAANNAYSLLYGGLDINGYATTDTYILLHGGSKIWKRY